MSIDNCEIELVERSGERPRGHFKESARWITGRKVKPKVVLHHANEENPDGAMLA